MILSRELGKRIWGGSTNTENGGGGVSSDYIAGLLAGYATESWVDEHYISIDFFSRLFQAHGTENGSEIDVMPNDMDTTITSVESMFGFWTNLYISALGSNGAAPAGISLGMLTDVNITGTPSAGQVLTYDVATQKWVNGNGGASSLATLTDVTLTSLQTNQILIYDAVTQKWVNSSVKTINGYSIFGTGDIPASGGGGGNYLPLAGGTMTGDITFSGNRFLRNGNGYAALMITNSWTTLGPQNIDAGIDTYIDGTNIHIRSGSQTDTILCNRNKIVSINGNLNVTGITGVWTQGIKVFPASDGVGFFYVGDTSNANALALTCIPNDNIYRIDILRSNYSASIQIPFANGTMALDGYCTGQRFYMDNGTNILYCNNSARLSILACGEAAATIQIRPLAMSNDNNCTTFLSNGNVGISTLSPSYKLHVAGTIYATGAITALSDARKKDITGEAGVTVEQIAHAPAVQFLWKDKERRKDGQQVGTLAQYWQTVLPEVVSDKGGELSMQYGVAALVSAIVTARKVVDHERRIHELEKENERLKEEISQLRLN